MSRNSKSFSAEGTAEQRDLPAGRFSSWLRRMRSAMVHDNGMDVPCGECNACCRSFQFIRIRPEETRTLSRIPRRLLFPAPLLPEGNVLLGYDENGLCPMLINGRCSVYEHRPLACRNYDCRIFSAAGIAAGGRDKATITRRIRRWKFSCPAKRDRERHSAVQAAARFLRNRAECFPAGSLPADPTQVAVLAVKVYGVFLNDKKKSCKIEGGSPDFKVAKAIMKANEKFEAGHDALKVRPV